MKINKYTKALIILVTICYSTFLFGCNSKSDFGVYADGTETAEEGHHHHHDDEDEDHDHNHEHEDEDHDHDHEDEDHDHHDEE